MTTFTPAKKALFIATTIYTLLLAIGYAWYTSSPTPAKELVKLTTVPVTLSMFQAPSPEPTPKAIKETLQPEAIKPIEPVVKPPITPPIEQPTEPKSKPKPPPPPKKVDVKPNELPPKIFEKPKDAPKTTTTPKPSVTPITVPLNSLPPVQVIENTTKEVTTQPIIPPEQSAHAEQSYLSELNSLIAQHAYNSYPRRAKRRNWQGEVSIQFTLLPNGRITRLSIIESSGRTLLDNAALQIFQVKMNQQFKPFPKEIVRTQWRIEVPVSYHLN